MDDLFRAKRMRSTDKRTLRLTSPLNGGNDNFVGHQGKIQEENKRFQGGRTGDTRAEIVSAARRQPASREPPNFLLSIAGADVALGVERQTVFWRHADSKHVPTRFHQIGDSRHRGRIDSADCRNTVDRRFPAGAAR